MTYDIIIVGAGAAGLTAAIYAVRANKTVLVLEGKTYGGQIISTLRVENYPGMPHVSGADFAKELYNQAVELGAKIEFEEVEKIERLDNSVGIQDSEAPAGNRIFKVTTDEEEYEARAIILATGSTDKKLGLESEERLFGRGVSYCATCDGALHKDEVVAVVGGGNTAFYDALYLADLARKVYVIHRRDEFRADKALVDKVKAKKNVEFVLNAKVEDFIGEDKLERVELSSTLDDSKKHGFEVTAAFVAIGRTPTTEKFTNLVELDENGYVISGEDCLTSEEGVFVAGDLREKTLHQLVTATSDGAIAATAAVNYLG